MDNVIFDELLYFLVNKMKTSTNNKIIAICAKFYSSDEITKSKEMLWEKIQNSPALSTTRKVGRTGEKKVENNLDDILKWIKAIDDAGESLPLCASLDMNRVPMTDDGSLTTAQIMKHNDDLRKEFVTIDSLKLCLDNMKIELLSSMKNTSSENDTDTVNSSPPLSTTSLSTPLSPSAPSFSQVEGSSDVRGAPVNDASDANALGASGAITRVVSGLGTNANHASKTLASIVETSNPATLLQQHKGKPTMGQRHPNTAPSRERDRSRNRQAPTIFVGNKVASGLVSFKGADLTVDRYVGRIDVNADNAEVKAFIENSGVTLIDFKENPRTHSSFKSFKITARRSDLPKLERDDFWPAGVIFRNYFRPRQRRDTAATASDFSSHPNG